MSNGHARWVFKNVRTPARKRVPLTSGSGFSTVPNGEVVADVELTIDLQRLALLLGRRAMKTLGKTSTLAGGLIKVKVIGDVRHEGGAS